MGSKYSTMSVESRFVNSADVKRYFRIERRTDPLGNLCNVHKIHCKFGASVGLAEQPSRAEVHPAGEAKGLNEKSG